MKMIDHNHFICHLILGTFTEYPYCLHIGNRELFFVQNILEFVQIFQKHREKSLQTRRFS